MARYFKIFMGLKIILCARGKGQIQDLRIGPTYVLCWRGSVGNSPSTSTAGYCGCVHPLPKMCATNLLLGGHTPQDWPPRAAPFPSG